MTILYIYSHPLDRSLHGAIRDRALAALGRSVDFLDLNAERFNPVLDARDREAYHDLARNKELVGAYVERVARARMLIMQFPTWNFGPPAILKGFLDRVLLPGTAFDLSDPKRTTPLLTGIERIVGIVTYGQPRHVAWWMGDPPRKLVTRHMRWYTGGRARVDYHALYHVNAIAEPRCRAFIDRVGRAMEKLGPG